MKDTTIAAAKTSPQDRENISVDVTTQYRRPSDLIVAVLAGLAFLLSLLIFLASRGYLPLGGLLFAARDFLPDSLTPFLGLVLESGVLALIVLAMLAALPLAGPRLARNLALGGVLAWLSTWVIRLVLESQGAGSLLDRMLQFPKTGEGLLPPAVAVAAALLLIADPYSNGRTRPLWWGLVVATLGLAVLVGSYGLLGILGALALGFLIGAVSNLLLGVPREDVSTRVIRQAFQEHGTRIKSVSRVRADARASVPYFARSDSGDEYFVKMIGPDQRDADFLFKLWRTVLLKRVAGSAPFLTPTQQIEHEAYLTLVAQKQQVRTPDIEFTARVAGDYALLAQKRVVARGLADLRDEELGDSLLSAIWTQVRNLHAARIYHGDLRTANLLVDRANQPWIIDFGFAAAGADDAVLGQDTAQVLASLAALAGAERTVESALQVLGPDPLRAALPALQPLALSSATREDLRYDPDLLDELKEALEAEVGPLPAQDQESVFRIQRRDVLLVLGLGVGVYALFPQLAQFQQIVKAWTAVNPIWIVLGLVGSFITYLSSAIAQQGALVKPLSFWRLLLVQFAATFGSRFSPQGVGAAYVIVRFLEKSGITRETAVTALAVKTTAGVVDHFILVGIVLALLGYSGASFFKGIQLWQIAAAVALIAAIIVVLRWKFPDRVDRAKQALRSSLHDLVTVLENPLRALELFGGSLAITLGYLVTFTICLWATGINISLIQIAAAFLGGSIIGSASPTPGGLGTVEAALVAALAVFGVSAGQAVAAVLLYRLLTFWLPIIPGFFAFRRLQHRNYL